MTGWEGIEEAVAVADAGSFAGAASALGLSSSHISRAVAHLEDKLQVQIFYRTTRRVTVTDDGRTLIAQLRHVIEGRDEAYARFASESELQGEVKLTCSIALGERFVVPIISQFALEHPKISVHIELTNRVMDLVAEGFDVAIRTGELADRRLIASRIASRRLYVCAAPSYLAQHSEPQTIRDLARHNCLIGTNTNWTFSQRGRTILHKVEGRWRCNSGPAILDAAVAGMGICQLPDFYVRKALNEGRLVALLTGDTAADETIWTVYPQHRHQISRVRAIVDRLRLHLQPALDHAF